jgi:CubicO group peptidase (beta-lactamase class C family)
VLNHIQVVDSILARFYREQHIPGMAYGVVMNGELIYANYQGFTDLASKTPVNKRSAFRIASMSKSVTAMAILILRDQGKLRLDAPAWTYIPEMKQTRYLTTDAPAITVRDLLTHRAGFPEDNPYGDRQLADTDAELMQLMKDNPSFSNVPGLYYEYSNLGFALLGTIIKNVSGQTYQQFITNQIFKPLGMLDTYWEYSKVPPSQLAHGYRWIDDQWKEEALLKDGSWGAMGGLITTVEDFAKYMNLHLQAWPVRDGKETGPLKRSSIREMHQLWNINNINPRLNNKDCAAAAGYGYGLGITRDCRGHLYIGHGGGLPGFGSHWMVKPNYNIGIVIFSNRTYAPASRLSLPILDSLIKLADLQPFQLPASGILEKRKTQLLSFLPDWKDAERSDIFAENFFPDYPIDALRKQAQTVFERAGPIKEITPVKPENNLRGSFDMIGERSIIRIYFTLSPEHEPKIQEYRISALR